MPLGPSKLLTSFFSDSIQRIERLLKSDSNLKADKFTSTIISQCANITRVSLLLAFIGKLIKEETDLKVITSSSIRGISATIDSPVNGTCKLYFLKINLLRNTRCDANKEPLHTPYFVRKEKGPFLISIVTCRLMINLTY